jgi:hypothetical protein
MNNLKFNEVAHLYIGCAVINVNENAFGDLDYFGKRSKLSHLLFDKYVNSEDWKPELRPFEDMTDEENEHLLDVSMKLNNDAKFYAYYTYYLTNRHIDLFGLIQNNQANSVVS